MLLSKSAGTVYAAAACIFCVASTADAIVYRTGMADTLSLGLATQLQFSGAGQVFNGANAVAGTGTLILSDWVLTSKQAIAGYSTASFKGTSGLVYSDPDSDLALIHLNSNVAGTPIAPAFFGGEPGMLGWLVGAGAHGSATGTITSDNQLRAGTNVVRENTPPYLYFDNGNNGVNSSVYESVTGSGDIGGPMFQQISNTWYVVGVASGGSGNTFFHTPTASNSSFILDTIRAVRNEPTFNFAAAVAPTTLYWDSDATASGTNEGSGTWDVQRPNFRSAVTGFNYQWDNALPADVIFGSGSGAGSTVTIASTSLTSGTKLDGSAGPGLVAAGVTAHNLTFNLPGLYSGPYTITGYAPLTLKATDSDPTITANVDATISAPITGTSAVITKAGAGTLTLWGSNSYAGTLRIAEGTLEAPTPAATPGYDSGRLSVATGGRFLVSFAEYGSGWTSANINSLAAGATFSPGSIFAINANYTTQSTYAGQLPAGSTFEKTGPYALVLTAPQTYTGQTLISQGNLTLLGTGRLPAATVLGYSYSSAFTVGSGVNQTISRFKSMLESRASLVVNGSGTITASSGFSLGGGQTSIDMGSLSAFVYDLPDPLNVNGYGTDIKLAFSITVTAPAFNVATGNDGATPTTYSLTQVALGYTTVLNVDSFQLGQGNARASVSTASSSGGSMTLRGKSGGSSRVNSLIVGFNADGELYQSSNLTCLGPTLDWRVGKFIIGDFEPTSGFSSLSGSFAMRNGKVDANAITLAYARASTAGGAAGYTTGTFTQWGGMVRTDALTLGMVGRADNGPVNLTASYNLGAAEAPATLAAQTITAGAITDNPSNTTATRTLNFTNGRITTSDPVSDLTVSGLPGGGVGGAANKTLNVVLAASGLHALTAPAGRTITFADSAPISGNGVLTVDGPGTVALNAANTYTGGTTISAGTLVASPQARTSLLGGKGTDLQNGRLVLPYLPGASPVASIRSLLAASYASAFASGTLRCTTGNGARGLVWLDDSAAVTVLPALFGDTDLDGRVDFNDFLNLQNNFGNSGTTFAEGDFNFNGVTDFNDFLILQNHFGLSIAGSDVSATLSQLTAMNDFALTIPEPGQLAPIIAGLVLFRRRRCRSSYKAKAGVIRKTGSRPSTVADNRHYHEHDNAKTLTHQEV